MRDLSHNTTIFINWLNDWMWWIFSAMLSTISLVGSSPLEHQQEDTLGQRLLVNLRLGLLYGMLIIMIVLPLLGYLFYNATSTPSIYFKTYMMWYLQLAAHYWRLALIAIIVPLAIRFSYGRYIATRWSGFKHRCRALLSKESLSDIRDEKEKYSYKNFDPVTYYKHDSIFFGMSGDNQPIYIPLGDWLETNLQIIGPTRFGKGILMGCLIDQAILNGYCVFYIDPKGDKNLPHIMADRAMQQGRDFIYCDLNDGEVGGWHPFVGGDMRSRRARVLMACGLEDTGNESDFYKINERGVLDELMQNTSKINGLLQIFRAKKTQHFQESAKRLYGKLVEWEKVKSLNPKSEGLNIEKSMLSNAVVYIRGSLDDHVVKDATRVLIVEIMQEAKRLEKMRASHLTVVIDEIRFLMSNQIADASATITGTDTNLILAYQSKTDLRNVNDVNVDAKAAESSINTNCQLKFIYGTQDPETGKWAEEMSGTMQKLITRSETTEIGQFGEEYWQSQRTLSQAPEGYITLNTMLSLDKRAGVLYQPSKLPQIIFTCFVQTSRCHTFDKQHYIKSQKSLEEPSLHEISVEDEVLQDVEVGGARRGVAIEELG